MNQTWKLQVSAVIAASMLLAACSKHHEKQPTEQTTPALAVSKAAVEGDTAQQAISTDAVQSVKLEPDLGVPLASFTTRFNDSMHALGRPYRMKAKLTNSEASDGFETDLSQNMSVIGIINEQSENVSEAALIALSDGTQISDLDALDGGLSLFAAALPKVDRREIGPVLLRLLKEAEQSPTHESSTVVNDVRLAYKREAMRNAYSVQPTHQ